MLLLSGYNLIQDTTACTITGSTIGNIVGVDARLGPLQNNGGQTLSHALLAGSPAIDAGGGACPDTDQRGVRRPVDGDKDGVEACDIAGLSEDPALASTNPYPAPRARSSSVLTSTESSYPCFGRSAPPVK